MAFIWYWSDFSDTWNSRVGFDMESKTYYRSFAPLWHVEGDIHQNQFIFCSMRNIYFIGQSASFMTALMRFQFFKKIIIYWLLVNFRKAIIWGHSPLSIPKKKSVILNQSHRYLVINTYKNIWGTVVSYQFINWKKKLKW